VGLIIKTITERESGLDPELIEMGILMTFTTTEMMMMRRRRERGSINN
jgi:hypothetical protein